MPATQHTSADTRKIGLHALQRGRLFTCLVFFLLLPLSRFAEPVKEKQLHTDLYVMF